MSDTTATTPKGIGGWLVLVVIGLLVTPIRIGQFMVANHWAIFRDGAWPILTTPGTGSYHVLWGPLIVFEIIGNTGSIVLALVVLWFLFRKSRSTPRLAITWLIWNTAFVVIDYFAADLIPVVAAQADPNSVKELMRSVLAAAIWIPYFLVSKRVKATFVL
jgi:hypothetical protein